MRKACGGRASKRSLDATVATCLAILLVLPCIAYRIFPIIAQRIKSLTSPLQSWTKERSEAFKGLCAKRVAEGHRSAALMPLQPLALRY
ncbi:MAG: hypothetical protein LKE41_03540 [Prevotella sp.]|nr:hypothetical protein [Prevotella sp.]